MTHIPKVIFKWPFGDFEYIFDWPVGTDMQRAAAISGLPEHWENTNPYGTHYEISPGVWNYHDGVDLNLNYPTHNLDYGHTIKSIGNGLVLFVGDGGGTWGLVMDIYYPLPQSYVVGRFAHWSFLDDPKQQPQVNDYVRVGQPVAKIGNIKNAYGKIYAHLHWNISAPGNDIMIERPNQWCGVKKDCVLSNYIDPIKFIVSMKAAQLPPVVEVPKPEEVVTPIQYYVNNTSHGFDTVNIRQWHSATSTIISTLKNGTPITGYDHTRQRDNYTWRLVDVTQNGTTVSGWCVTDKLTTAKPPA